MARIRSLHPGQTTDEDFVQMSCEARLFALHLRCEADDNGVFEWKPVALKMRIFPVDNVDVEAILSEMEANNQVRQFQSGGKTYGAIRNFCKWQKPKSPKSVHPIPDDFRNYVGLTQDNSETDGDKPETIPPKEETAPQREEGGGKREEVLDSSDPDGSVVGGADPPERIPIRKAFDNYNIAATEFGLPSAKTLTPDRERKIRQRLKEHGIQGWNRALETIGDSPFLKGDNNRGWRADLDFLLQPKSFNRLIEGAYTPEDA